MADDTHTNLACGCDSAPPGAVIASRRRGGTARNSGGRAAAAGTAGAAAHGQDLECDKNRNGLKMLAFYVPFDSTELYLCSKMKENRLLALFRIT